MMGQCYTERVFRYKVRTVQFTRCSSIFDNALMKNELMNVLVPYRNRSMIEPSDCTVTLLMEKHRYKAGISTGIIPVDLESKHMAMQASKC